MQIGSIKVEVVIEKSTPEIPLLHMTSIHVQLCIYSEVSVCEKKVKYKHSILFSSERIQFLYHLHVAGSVAQETSSSLFHLEAQHT